MQKLTEITIIILGVMALVCIIALLISVPFWLLWNWLMPQIFGLKSITWIQALGLAVLSGMIFKSTASSSSKK